MTGRRGDGVPGGPSEETQPRLYGVWRKSVQWKGHGVEPVMGRGKDEGLAVGLTVPRATSGRVHLLQTEVRQPLEKHLVNWPCLLSREKS